MQISGLGSLQLGGQAVPQSFHTSLGGQPARITVFECQMLEKFL